MLKEKNVNKLWVVLWVATTIISCKSYQKTDNTELEIYQVLNDTFEGSINKVRVYNQFVIKCCGPEEEHIGEFISFDYLNANYQKVDFSAFMDESDLDYMRAQLPKEPQRIKRRYLNKHIKLTSKYNDDDIVTLPVFSKDKKYAVIFIGGALEVLQKQHGKWNLIASTYIYSSD